MQVWGLARGLLARAFTWVLCARVRAFAVRLEAGVLSRRRMRQGRRVHRATGARRLGLRVTVQHHAAALARVRQAATVLHRAQHRLESRAFKGRIAPGARRRQRRAARLGIGARAARLLRPHRSARWGITARLAVRAHTIARCAVALALALQGHSAALDRHLRSATRVHLGSLVLVAQPRYDTGRPGYLCMFSL